MVGLSETARRDEVAETSVLLIPISLTKGTTYMLYMPNSVYALLERERLGEMDLNW